MLLSVGERISTASPALRSMSWVYRLYRSQEAKPVSRMRDIIGPGSSKYERSVSWTSWMQVSRIVAGYQGVSYAREITTWVVVVRIRQRSHCRSAKCGVLRDHE